MPDLLIEIGCEELPASACREALEQTPLLATSFGERVGLDLSAGHTWVSPRRIAFAAFDIPEVVAGAARSARGPAAQAGFDADGTPTKAAIGFARGQGVAVDELVTREVDGRAFIFAEHPAVSRPVDELVPALAGEILNGLRFSKNMRWGDGLGLRFSRPVRWVVVKLGEATIPVDLHGLPNGDVSQGHRFLGAPATIARAGAYRDALREVCVVVDQNERRERIVTQLDEAARNLGGTWSDPGGKLEEVLHLVEWPSVLSGTIGERFRSLPQLVLVTAMQSHQRYFPVEVAGALAGFLAVSNGDPAHADVITRGNEGVLNARLQDAAFSFERDRAAGLTALDARLDDIIFHAKLGSLASKRERLVATVTDLTVAAAVSEPDRKAAEVAARLAKVDQGAVLVAEFSDLQGHVAAEYARLEGHPEAVCRAIESQFLPEGPDSALPESVPGALVALAEKIDNLVGAFAIGEAPTGSKDPYGLRRAASGLVRIILARGWNVDLAVTLGDAHDRFAAQGADLSLDRDGTTVAVTTFVADRLAHALGLAGVDAEASAAAEGAQLGSLPATAELARFIQDHRSRDAFQASWTASTRVSRLVAKAPDGATYTPAGDSGEDALAAAIAASRPGVESARAGRNPAAALDALAPLTAAIDQFFVDVMVNADDPAARSRRYGLLGEARDIFALLCDFSAITQGGSGR